MFTSWASRPTDLFAASGHRADHSGGHVSASSPRCSTRTEGPLQPAFSVAGALPMRSTSRSYTTEWPYKSTMHTKAPPNGLAGALDVTLPQEECHLHPQAGAATRIGASNHWLTRGRGGGSKEPARLPSPEGCSRSPSPRTSSLEPTGHDKLALHPHSGLPSDLDAHSRMRGAGAYSSRREWSPGLDGAAGACASKQQLTRSLSMYNVHSVDHALGVGKYSPRRDNENRGESNRASSSDRRSNSSLGWQHFGVRDIDSTHKHGVGKCSPRANPDIQPATIRALHGNMMSQPHLLQRESCLAYQELALKTDRDILKNGLTRPAKAARPGSCNRISSPTRQGIACPLGRTDCTSSTSMPNGHDAVTARSQAAHASQRQPNDGRRPGDILLAVRTHQKNPLRVQPTRTTGLISSKRLERERASVVQMKKQVLQQQILIAGKKNKKRCGGPAPADTQESLSLLASADVQGICSESSVPESQPGSAIPDQKLCALDVSPGSSAKCAVEDADDTQSTILKSLTTIDEGSIAVDLSGNTDEQSSELSTARCVLLAPPDVTSSCPNQKVMSLSDMRDMQVLPLLPLSGVWLEGAEKHADLMTSETPETGTPGEIPGFSTPGSVLTPSCSATALCLSLVPALSLLGVHEERVGAPPRAAFRSVSRGRSRSVSRGRSGSRSPFGERCLQRPLTSILRDRSGRSPSPSFEKLSPSAPCSLGPSPRSPSFDHLIAVHPPLQGEDASGLNKTHARHARGNSPRSSTGRPRLLTAKMAVNSSLASGIGFLGCSKSGNSDPKSILELAAAGALAARATRDAAHTAMSAYGSNPLNARRGRVGEPNFSISSRRSMPSAPLASGGTTFV